METNPYNQPAVQTDESTVISVSDAGPLPPTQPASRKVHSSMSMSAVVLIVIGVIVGCLIIGGTVTAVVLTRKSSKSNSSPTSSTRATVPSPSPTGSNNPSWNKPRPPSPSPTGSGNSGSSAGISTPPSLSPTSSLPPVSNPTSNAASPSTNSFPSSHSSGTRSRSHPISSHSSVSLPRTHSRGIPEPSHLSEPIHDYWASTPQNRPSRPVFVRSHYSSDHSDLRSSTSITPSTSLGNPVSAANTIAQRLDSIQENSRTQWLRVDRAEMNSNPGYIFNHYSKPLLISNVNFIGENGVDCAGLTNDFMSSSLEFYATEDEDKRVIESNGVFGESKDQRKIRDLTRFALMCLAKEDRNLAFGALSATCPITKASFSPFNIWLAMVDEDQNTDEYHGWKNKTIGTEVLKGRNGLKSFPDRDDEVENYFRNVVMTIDDDEPAPKTVREMVRHVTSDAPRIVREVLEEYGMLTVVREAYRDGTLMQYLNELWKPEWGKESGRRLKARVRELVGRYPSKSFKAFNDWVQRHSNDDESLRSLWNYWTGSTVLMEHTLRRADLRSMMGSSDPNNDLHFIHSHTCFIRLDIPDTLNDDNIDNVMRVSLQSSAFGSM